MVHKENWEIFRGHTTIAGNIDKTVVVTKDPFGGMIMTKTVIEYNDGRLEEKTMIDEARRWLAAE